MLRIARSSAGRRCYTAASIVALLLSATAYAQVGPEEDRGNRFALIIGNNAYSVSPLQNAVSDAQAMDKALRAVGFQTLLRENATLKDMHEATSDLLVKVGPRDTVLFFYAGHAVQIENDNRLVPVDFAAGNSIIASKYQCFSLGELIEELKRLRVKTTILILDACRSNPLVEQHSLLAGLGIPPNPGKETYIAFSTGPGKVATDNPDGKNSWFTEALADLISQPVDPSLSLDKIFTAVRLRVEEATKGRQTPWTQTSLKYDFYFRQPKNIENPTTILEKWFRDAQQHIERKDWSDAIKSLQSVLKNKPDQSLEQKAKSLMAYVTARNDALLRFEAGDFGTAGGSYEQALRVDPFSMDAALESVNCYLLSDRLPDAVRILKEIRLRGSSTVSEKAQGALKELAAAYPDVEKELKNGTPQPPPIQEIFGGVHFGAPDWDAGKRYLREHPPELARWVKELTPLPPLSETGDQKNAITPDWFHVEIKSDARNTEVYKLGRMGFMDITTSQPGAVLLNGENRSERVPGKLEVPPGRYIVSSVQQGTLLVTREVEVRAGDTTVVKLEQ